MADHSSWTNRIHSLKYHRLHPEYIYTRIRNLQGRYNLRVLLTMVDITNHEDSLRELSKTSLVNSVTVMLCWSAAECARYLELYKSLEHSASGSGFAAIRAQQATTYAERLVEFITVPRSINKTDAVSLVSAFGSLRNAVNADPDQVAVIGGWGEKKVKSWCRAVQEPFRIRKASRKGAAGLGSQPSQPRSRTSVAHEEALSMGTALRPAVVAGKGSTGMEQQAQTRPAGTCPAPGYDEEAMIAAAMEESLKDMVPAARREEDKLSDGVAAALARLREKG